ncbi:MAG: GNAT family N-acetyltransferase [Chloroflexi bacterium]|nr:GNAT family N-acetyltransferase [Chloroflexota bacterium]
MANSVNMVIRDAVLDDVAGCLALDHRYETDHVWQMHIRQEEGWHITFRPERLPRQLESQHIVDARRLEAALTSQHCFVVASDRDTGDLLGYLTMRLGSMPHLGHIFDFAVDEQARRCGLGSRLFSVAQNWARERQIARLQVAVQTTNYPAILFLQSLGYTFCGFNEHHYPNRDIAVFFSQAVR